MQDQDTESKSLNVGRDILNCRRSRKTTNMLSVHHYQPCSNNSPNMALLLTGELPTLRPSFCSLSLMSTSSQSGPARLRVRIQSGFAAIKSRRFLASRLNERYKATPKDGHG